MHHADFCRKGTGDNCVISSIERFFRHIIYANVVVSTAASVLCAGFCHLLGIDTANSYGLFVFFATLAVYNGQRIFKAEQPIQTPWLIWVGSNKKALTFLVIAAFLGAMVLFVLLQKWNGAALSFVAIAGAISVLYVWRVNGRSLREIPYLKIHLIAFAWTFLLILFPLLNEGIKGNVLAIGGAHYAYFLAIAIPFDIRDLKYDLPAQKTVPQVIGVRAAKVLSSTLLLLYGCMMAFLFPNLISNGFFYGAMAVQLLLILNMNEQRSDGYCAGAIDGSIVLVGASYCLANVGI